MEMLLTKALDERDLLKRRIERAIDNLDTITVKRKKDANTSAGVTAEKFSEDAQANYQSITDLIKRYDVINAAIIKSNAETNIKIGDKEMSVATAIQLRKRYSDGNLGANFESKLLHKLAKDLSRATTEYTSYTREADRQAEVYKSNFLEKDNNRKLSEDEIEAINKLTADLEPEYIDPIDTAKVVANLNDFVASIVYDINSAIKISNSTTTVEIPD